MQGLRSGKLKIVKEKQTVQELDDVSESGNVGVDDKSGIDGEKKKKVNGEVPIVGRVLRSRVVGSGGEGVVEIGKRRRRLVDNGDGKKGKGEKAGGNVGVGVRVLRSQTVESNGVVEDVGVMEKRKRHKLLVMKGENVADDCLDKKGRDEGGGKVLNAGRVLRSRTVVNGDCVKAECSGRKAERDDVNVESNGYQVEDVGVMEKRKRQKLLVMKGENVADDCLDKKGRDEGGGKVLNAGRVLRSRTVVNGDCVKAECSGRKAERDDVNVESNGYQVESHCGRAESGGDKADSGMGVKAEAESGGDKTDSDMGVKAEAESNGDKVEGDSDMDDTENGEVTEFGKSRLVSNGGSVDNKKLKETEPGDKTPVAGRVLRSRTVRNGVSEVVSDDVKAESDDDKAESDGDKAESSGNKAESDGGEVEIDGGEVESGGAKSVDDKAEAESNGDKVDSDSDMGECENVEVVEFEKKTRLAGNGSGVDKKKLMETEVSDKMPVSSRLLRSRAVVNGGSMAESDAALVRECRRKDGCQYQLSDMKNEGEVQLVTGCSKKMKGKHGRPRKAEKEESGTSDVGFRQVKGKRGRPQVSEIEESDGRFRKKLRSGQNSSDLVKGNLDKKGNVYFRSNWGSKSQERFKSSTLANHSYLERKRIGKALNVKASSQVKRDYGGKYSEREDSEDEDGHLKQKQKQRREEKQESKSKDGRRERKQAVSEKIVKMILAAGWKIERRQRNGRAYKDAVYVCPAGKTHWSVTKAYNAFKLGCENGDPMACNSGFKFTPIRPEELSILKRVGGNMKKKEGKGGGQGKKHANQKEKDGDASGVEEKRKKSLRKSLKGKKQLLEDASTSTSYEGKLCLVQRHKRQKIQNRKRCSLLVRNTENADLENDGYIPYDGKRTVLAWMIDLGTLALNSKLKYMKKRKRQVLLEGKIATDGIHCGCCDRTISLSEFVTHTRSDYSEPLRYILTDSGSSLLQCLLNSWNKQDESERRGFHFVEVTKEDPNDDTCGICGDGGDLICCDGCPSTFHKSCLEIKKFPSGDWHCVYCSCKFCGLFEENMSQTDGSEDVAASALLTCQSCEEKYHQCCIKAKDAVNGDSSSPSFCAKNCQELFEKLDRLLGVRHEVEEGFSLTLLRRFDVGDTPQKVDCNSKLIECNAKLAVAFLIMDECFLPMVDHRSGVNLIHNILYNRGSNFNRLNYGGFFTAVLERGDEIISAATIRIHGNYLAEMPFIGTRYMYRRQGMCRRLLSAIESALGFLNVERLVIPAISELTETWTSVFGFKSLEESSKQKMKNMNILVFPGVDILQKPLLNQLTESEGPVKGSSFGDLEHHKTMKDDECNTEPLVRSDSQATVSCAHEGNDELTAVQSDTQLLCCGVSHDILESKSNTTPLPIDSVCDVLEPTKEINENQNSPSVADVRALELVGKQITDLLCDTAEGFFAGADMMETVSFKDEANDELVAVESDTELLRGVLHDYVEREKNTPTIPTGSISDPQNQTENAQLLFGVSRDNLMEKNTLTIPAGSISDAHDQIEERIEHQNSVSFPDIKEVELGTEHNQPSMSKVERKTDLHSKGTYSTIEVFCSLGEGTENIDHKVTEDAIVKPLGSHVERFCRPCAENNACEPQMVSFDHEAKFSTKTAVCADPEITTHDARDHKHYDSQHLQGEGSIFHPDEKMLETFEVENNHSCMQHTSTVTEGVHPESVKFSDSVLTNASKVARDEFRQAGASTHEKKDDSKCHTTTLLFGCSITCISGNGQDTHKVVSTPADNNYLPSCGDNIESNGTSKSPDSPRDDLTSCGAKIDSNGNSKSLHAPGIDLTSCGVNFDCNGSSKTPDVPVANFISIGDHMNTKSLVLSDFDSDVDNNSLRQPNSSNTCASGGGNSFGASEVTILSNQGQTS